MAMIVETAGGIASTGMFKVHHALAHGRGSILSDLCESQCSQGAIHRMLDLVPTKVHERCPVILGCPRDVELVLQQYKS